jgi:hypothetical protein
MKETANEKNDIREGNHPATSLCFKKKEKRKTK